MKSFGDKLRVLLAVLFSASILAAGEAEERELGNKAFFSGDYLTAVSHYRSARILSDQETLTEAWAQNTLKLGKAQLFAGDIAGARATLAEFRQRHSARSAGTLEADLLAAEGKYDAAEDLYLKMESSGDNELRNAAAFGRAGLLLRRGKSAAAAAIFQQLADGNSIWHYPARRELAYTMIRMKQYAGALKQLELIPESQRGVSFSLLYLLAKVYSGDMGEFKQSWRKVISRQLRRPDPLSCELLFTAAGVAMKQQDKVFAVELLNEADKFAPDGETRRNILKQLINFQHTFDPDGAAKSALIYAGLFPADPERFDVLMNAASILAGEKKFSGSLTLLQHLIRQTGFSRGQRFQAAMRGAGYAEHGSDIKTAAEFFQAAVAFAPDAKAMMNCRRRYVEFLLRHRDYASAMKELRSALKSGREDGKDDLKFLLLEAAVRDNDLKTASETATALLTSENLYYRGRAHYELGNIAAQRGDHAAARREFLKAAALKEAEQYAVSARYSAALTAFKLGDFRSAGSEALALASDNPEFAHSPQALFIGYRSARQLNDENLKLQCARLLRNKYPRSSAFAVCALQDAADRAAANRDFSGALAELDVLEQQFADDPQIVTESMLMRIELLKLSGRKNDAVDTAQQLLNRYPGSAAAYYAAMQGGNICFSTSRFKEAIAFFETAGKLRREGLEHDMALARNVEVMLHTRDSRMIPACEELIFQSKFPQIRLRMRYYRGLALEFAGNKEGALQSYQEMLNEALLCREKGIPFSRNLCVRGATAALQLVYASRRRTIFERGIRIIGCCRILELNKEGIDPDQLQQELERKFSANIKRR